MIQWNWDPKNAEEASWACNTKVPLDNGFYEEILVLCRPRRLPQRF
jgi:hypothetical protein